VRPSPPPSVLPNERYTSLNYDFYHVCESGNTELLLQNCFTLHIGWWTCILRWRSPGMLLVAIIMRSVSPVHKHSLHMFLGLCRMKCADHSRSLFWKPLVFTPKPHLPFFLEVPTCYCPPSHTRGFLSLISKKYGEDGTRHCTIIH